MCEYQVAVIGTGADPSNPTIEGFAMGYRHAEAYRNHERCRIVACADIVEENAAAFAQEFDVPEENRYADYEAMLDDVEPDLVSVTVPPALHEPIVVDCAKHDAVDAIHCEKPIAHTWESAQRTVQTCWRHRTQLTFNRQRRFAAPFVEANRLLDEGRIGRLRRIEIGWGDFYDTGAHAVDLAGMFNDDRPAEWVIAQVDYREEDIRFGAHQENQMWAQWRYENGVYGMISTGDVSDMIDAAILLRGTTGVIRIDADDGPTLELDRGGERTAIDVDGESIHYTGSEPDDRFGSHFHDRVVDHVIESLEAGEESKLSGRLGLNTAEILFAGYESARRRGRVDLPLDIDGNPLEEMVESGALSPEPTVE